MADYREHFKLKVYVFQRPNMRDPALDMEMYVGRGVLDSIFDKMEMRPDVTELVLSYPERWLNIVEQRSLYSRLIRYCPNLKEVTIKTHSVYIIQCTHNTDIGIVKIPEGEHLPQESDEGKLYFDTNAFLMFNRTGLNIVGGSINKVIQDGLETVSRPEPDVP